MVTKLCRIPSAPLLRYASRTAQGAARPPKPQLGLRTCLPRDSAARARTPSLCTLKQLQQKAVGAGGPSRTRRQRCRQNSSPGFWCAPAPTSYARARPLADVYTAPPAAQDGRPGLHAQPIWRALPLSHADTGRQPSVHSRGLLSADAGQGHAARQRSIRRGGEHNIVIQRRSMSPDEMRELVRPRRDRSSSWRWSTGGCCTARRRRLYRRSSRVCSHTASPGAVRWPLRPHHGL